MYRQTNTACIDDYTDVIICNINQYLHTYTVVTLINIFETVYEQHYIA